jgi:hypothetical protein
MTIGKITVGKVMAKSSTSMNIRVDRKSPLGNPSYMKHESKRDEVCDEFILHLEKQAYSDGPFRDELIRIFNLVKDGQDVNLQCWCAPKRCHADSIKAILEKELRIFS